MIKLPDYLRLNFVPRAVRSRPATDNNNIYKPEKPPNNPNSSVKMNIHSWFRRTKTRSPSQSTTTTTNENKEEQQLYGITDDLINHVKSFTLETFRNFNLQDEQGAVDGTESTAGIVHKDLSSWQEKHALLVLSKVKELSQLRFKLCPRYLKERQFWRIYFTLVKNHVAKYELHAIRLEKLKQIAIENKKDPNTSAVEVEMFEARKPANLQPTPSLE